MEKLENCLPASYRIVSMIEHSGTIYVATETTVFKLIKGLGQEPYFEKVKFNLEGNK